jgi:cytochrome c-type biogenesis protein CcmH
VHKLIFVCLFLIANLAQASVALPVAADPELEKRVMAISEELRCLVCQNQTIADSHADLAVDLKNQVRDMLVQGKSNKEVTDYMVERYGDFVMYRPPVKNTTWLLWFGPFLLLVGGIGFLGLKLKNRQPSVELPEGEMQRAAQLLRSDADASADIKDTK